jgi:hypothetical protein
LRGLGRFSSILSISTLLVGCFRYVPTPLETAPTTEDVRVHLTRVALAQVPEDFPTGDTFLSGRLVAVAPDSVVLRVPVTRRVDGFGVPELRQDVHIARGGIVEVQRQEVDGLRTGLTVAAATGAATALVLLIIDASGSSDPDPGDLPDQMRVPLLSVSLR